MQLGTIYLNFNWKEPTGPIDKKKMIVVTFGDKLSGYNVNN